MKKKKRRISLYKPRGQRASILLRHVSTKRCTHRKKLVSSMLHPYLPGHYNGHLSTTANLLCTQDDLVKWFEFIGKFPIRSVRFPQNNTFALETLIQWEFRVINSKELLTTLCSHLVPEHSCPGTGTKWCCVQTLGTCYVDAQCSARVQGRDLVLGHGHRARILAWVLEKKGLFT